jgi:hypothetical protein
MQLYYSSCYVQDYMQLAESLFNKYYYYKK